MKSSNLCIALTAHVDAGKTTLSESILWNTGVIRKPGRVDHKDSFLDHEKEERERGITIFSKQALFELSEKQFTLIDTPGHVDFSAEMERALSVLDYMIWIISGPDGLHGHDLTLWRLFERYQLPVFVFVNKMDQPGVSKETVLSALEGRLGRRFAVWPEESFVEAAAMQDEELLERYLANESLQDSKIASLVAKRKLFPVIFGSALKNIGVDTLLDCLRRFTEFKTYPDAFGARIYKVSRDAKNNRLVHLKVTGGMLTAKSEVQIHPGGRMDPANDPKEKADQILRYQGQRPEQIREASAGMIVSVSGLSKAKAGDTLGQTAGREMPLMLPLFSSRMELPADADPQAVYLKIKGLEEEIPEISLQFDEALGEISASLMGEVQTEVLQSILKDRYDLCVSFSAPAVICRETVTKPVYCAGHYEPLKHYAEVHLVLEPAERGSGVEAVSDLSEDILPRHYQRLILSHVLERLHRGTLTGGNLTDVRVHLVNARAHEKHTEGGDFRQATYRAIRQGLMKARSEGSVLLLEPYVRIMLRVPAAAAGRAMTDLSRLCESFSGPDLNGEEAVFAGRAVASKLQGYDRVLRSYTGGFGELSVSFDGYDRCLDPETVIRESGYDPELDAAHPSGSVFCAQGAGYYMPWDEVDAALHLEKRPIGRVYDSDDAFNSEDGLYGRPDADDPGSRMKNGGWDPGTSAKETRSAVSGKRKGKAAGNGDYLGAGLKADLELEEIFRQTLGNNRRTGKREERKTAGGGLVKKTDRTPQVVIREPLRQYLLVDGYNIIFAWDDLKEMARENLDAARAALTDIMANYQGFAGMTLILVFDAYKVRGGLGSIEKFHGIYVVYTKEAQTADAYIEQTVHEIGRKQRVTVATSDGLEQSIVFGEGAYRMSARELREAVEASNIEIREHYIHKTTRLENRIEI